MNQHHDREQCNREACGICHPKKLTTEEYREHLQKSLTPPTDPIKECTCRNDTTSRNSIIFNVVSRDRCPVHRIERDTPLTPVEEKDGKYCEEHGNYKKTCKYCKENQVPKFSQNEVDSLLKSSKVEDTTDWELGWNKLCDAYELFDSLEGQYDDALPADSQKEKVKTFIKHLLSTTRREAEVQERMRAFEILHKYAMETTDPMFLTIIENTQREILDNLTTPQE